MSARANMLRDALTGIVPYLASLRLQYALHDSTLLWLATYDGVVSDYAWDNIRKPLTVISDYVSAMRFDSEAKATERQEYRVRCAMISLTGALDAVTPHVADDVDRQACVRAWLTGDYRQIFNTAIGPELDADALVAAAKLQNYQHATWGLYADDLPLYEYAQYGVYGDALSSGTALAAYRASLIHYVQGNTERVLSMILGCSASDAELWRFAITLGLGGRENVAIAAKIMLNSCESTEEIADLICEHYHAIPSIDWYVDARETIEDTIQAYYTRLAGHPYSASNERKLIDQFREGLVVFHGTADIARYRDRDDNASICYAVDRRIAERYGRRAVGGSGSSGHAMVDPNATLVSAAIPAGAKVASTADLNAVLIARKNWSDITELSPTWQWLDREDIQDALRDAGFEYAIIRDGCHSDYLAIRALVRVDDISEEVI